MKRYIRNTIWFIILGIGMVSCFPTRNVPEGSYLYQGNSYSIKGTKVPSHNISAYYLQKNNRNILIFKPYVWFYDLGTHFKDSSFIYRFFTKTLGEEPILYDSTLIFSTADNIRQHMYNLGYYNTQVNPIISKYNYLKIASVRYEIHPHKPYTLRNVNFDINNRSIRSYVLADWNKSYLDSGTIFSTAQLKLERDRIAKNLRNLGFYYFSKQQISFEADSALNNFQIDLKLKISNQNTQESDSLIRAENKQYKYRRIYIFPEISMANNNLPTDTTIITYDYDHLGSMEYYFIHQGPMEVNPKAILQGIFLKPQRFYKFDDITQSYQSLYNLNIYKYINISIRDLKDNSSKFGQLDCIIQLSKLSKLSISSDSEIKNTGGDLGIEQGFNIVSRNTFKNAEILRIGLRGALEVQNISNTSTSDPNKIFNLFNTFEAGINTALEIPRFLAPIKRNFFSRYFNPKTILEVGYNYQDRPDYNRTIINGNFGYKWIGNIKTTHLLNPIELSSVKIFPEADFQKVIDSYQDPRIKYSYQDHMVLGMSYSYIYNETKLKSKKPFKFFFGKIELGGIPYNFISNAFGGMKDSLGQNWIGKLPYTQFVRFETDYRYYIPAGNGNLLHAFRFNLGLGLPLGGSVAIPFEKSFYIGGANSLRAWTLGSLGPGSYSSGSKSFEMTGDIRIEFNYEFRFPISGPLKGATFTDIGNIYLIKNSDALPDGTFEFGTFVPKLAADIGYGIRYDMSFLVIRFDVAHPIYQPYRPIGNRWSMLSEGVDPKLIWTFNFAIGYPF